MCLGTPGSSLAGNIFRSGPSGFVRDKLFGKGTSQKITDKLDGVHRKLFGTNDANIGVAPGTIPGPNKKRGNIDFAAEKKEKRLKTALADKKSFLLANHRNTGPSILGG